MHSATTVYMGAHGSNVIESDNWLGVAATHLAGLCVHLDDEGDLDLASAAGGKLGIALGRSLSDTNRISVARRGLRIPVLLTNGLTPVIGAQVQISTTTGKAVSSGTAVNAVYVTSTLTAYDEDGVAITDGAALIDFPGGL
jgi:hypothetical protein